MNGPPAPPEPREKRRRVQFRLGSLLLAVTVAGCVVGLLGPPLLNWLGRPRPAPPANFPRPARQTLTDDLDAYYLEPAETPLN